MSLTPTVDDETTINIEASERIFQSLPRDGSIRVVHIQPGSYADNIVCRLEQAQCLGDSPSYDALSYVWGTFGTEECIDLGGEKFRVTPNLGQALRGLRDNEKAVTLWIDALCITQTDNAEKAEQIRLMGDIYKRARRVVAFLGGHEDGSWELFRILKLEKSGRRSEMDPFRLHDIQLAERLLLRRRYWQRAWVVQELVLASDKYLQCGSDRISFSTLEAFHTWITSDVILEQYPETDSPRPVPNVGPGPGAILHSEKLVAYPNKWHSRFEQLASTESHLSLAKFLTGFLESQCKDPRDHIYAFYNLLPADFQRETNINYDTAADKLICQAMRAIVKVTRSLNIITLRSRQASPAEEWQDALPSWCPFLGVPYMNPPEGVDDVKGLHVRASDDNPTFLFPREVSALGSSEQEPS
ncbi:heterokaryon incompatibility protein-domain-containing protein [Aspergillus carlsbadensis]|nr:heterokaryon incompatibility protein-domain-containing protein [Aspergillus carlsbadensis]